MADALIVTGELYDVYYVKSKNQFVEAIHFSVDDRHQFMDADYLDADNNIGVNVFAITPEGVMDNVQPMRDDFDVKIYERTDLISAYWTDSQRLYVLQTSKCSYMETIEYIESIKPIK